MTEAERLAIARDVLGKADTLETTPRETALAGDPTGLGTSRPATNAVDPSQLFSLLVMGSLGGQTIPRDDPQTWARLGYFLQIEAARRFFLVHPDGSIKSILPKGYTGNPPPTPSAGGEPEYRLVIRASAQQGRSIRFYGKQLANTYSCTIQCTIEQRRGGKYFAIDGIPITEQFTPTKPVPQAQILRTAYDMALQKLAAGLQSRQFFQSRA